MQNHQITFLQKQISAGLSYVSLVVCLIFGFVVCLFVCRITAAGQTDKRDSLGVCADSRSDTDSLQRDQAVCISTNGMNRTI